LHVILSCFVSYVIGSYPTAYFVTNLFIGQNIYKKGDKNAGGTNAYYITRSILAFCLIAVFDALKAFIAAGFSLFILKDFWLATLISGVFATLGHNYSVFKGFKGGKGASTTTGVLIFINPLLVIGFLALFTLLINLNKYLKITTKEFAEVITRTITTTLICFIFFPEYWIHVLSFQLVSVLKYSTEKQWLKEMLVFK
jgi:glycerol-3-phosphate acyltransferase PlsY